MKANQAHFKVMKNVMKFCVNAKEHGIIINTTGNRNGKVDEDYFFEIIRVSDSDYENDIVTQRSVSVYVF
jgi:hypothetical protein